MSPMETWEQTLETPCLSQFEKADCQGPAPLLFSCVCSVREGAQKLLLTRRTVSNSSERKAKSHKPMLTHLASQMPTARQVRHCPRLGDAPLPLKWQMRRCRVTFNRRDGRREHQKPRMHCLFLSHFGLNCCDLNVSRVWDVVVK